jgi:hypothetical protein
MQMDGNETVKGFKDRTAGLMVFGFLQVILGGICALLALGLAAASELTARTGGHPIQPRVAMTTNIVNQLLFAAYFITIGVGSIGRRRWARALGLIVSALWLIVGVLTMALLPVLLPRFKVLIPPSGESVVIPVIITFLALIYVVVPGILFLFYRSLHVRATVEEHDRKTRWTDRVPLPVLALSVVMAFSAVACLSNAFSATLPLLGTILTGASATIICVALAGLFATLAVQLYRLKKSAWWTLLLLDIAGMVLGALTMARTDFASVFEKSGVMTPQLRAMHLEQMYKSPILWGIGLVSWAGFVAYLFYVRRFFNESGPRTRAADAAPVAPT